MALNLIGLQEIAKLLGISQATLRSWRHRGKLPKEDYIVSGNPVWEYKKFEQYVTQDSWLQEHSNEEVTVWG